MIKLKVVVTINNKLLKMYIISIKKITVIVMAITYQTGVFLAT